MISMKKDRSFAAFCLISVAIMAAWYFRNRPTVIDSDGTLYYQYFVNGIVNRNLSNGEFIKYPLGSTLLQLPFLLCGYLYALVRGANPINPYSFTFQTCVFLSAVVYCMIGLYFVYRMIKQRQYTEKSAILTVTALLYGTMLLEYTIKRASFSHAYGFFAGALFAFYIDYYERKALEEKITPIYDVALGLILCLNCLIRNTNIIVGFVYLLYNVDSIKSFRDRIRIIFSRRILLQIISFAALFFTQVFIWRVQSGRWLLFSYGDERFLYLMKPQILKVLFSDAKGLFIYNPVLIFGLFGFILNLREFRRDALAWCIILLIQTYLISAWWCWWLGTAYGERMYCDFLWALSVPMASVFNMIDRNEDGQGIVYITIKCLIYAFAIVFILLNLVWMYGIYTGRIPENVSVKLTPILQASIQK